MHYVLVLVSIWYSLQAPAQENLAVGSGQVSTAPAGLPEGALHPDAARTNNEQKTAVWKPFITAFNRCIAKIFRDPTGCQPIGYEVMGAAMCHKEQKAIDVHAMKCKIGGEWKYYWGTEDTGFEGSKYKDKNFKPSFSAKNFAIANYNTKTDAKSEGPHNYFSQLAACMGGARNKGGVNVGDKPETGIGCMWHVCSIGRSDATACHRDHLHCGTGCKSASL